ncbi:MAG: hypothetical protein IPN96_18095 [Anaerolineales bacterium]|nr:hypothetical protein [Anaerolineales bacterium]
MGVLGQISEDVGTSGRNFVDRFTPSMAAAPITRRTKSLPAMKPTMKTKLFLPSMPEIRSRKKIAILCFEKWKAPPQLENVS